MPTVGVVTFPGSNCDADFRFAVEQVDGLTATALWHKQTDLSGVDAVVLPGGFSYGDYLRAGAIARFSPIMAEVVRFARAGGPVLGVCNGFQILCEAGLLPVVLLRNERLAFLCHDVFVRVEGRQTPFTRGVQGPLRFPIAHGEGNWYADDETFARCEQQGQLVFRYCDADGGQASAPNGARGDVAGVCSEAGNVVGLMPHPERVVDPVLGGTDGLRVLESLKGVL